MQDRPVASAALPTRRESLIFAAKAGALRLRRRLADRRDLIPLSDVGDARDFPIILAGSRSPLWTEGDSREQRLELGKVHNLRLVCAALNGRVARRETVFSFWRHIGRPTRSRGFVAGRQIQSGCVVPAVAGGICQLTNALFQACLDAGIEVVERHPHTRRLANSTTPAGRDATVAWNYIDLRFRPASDVLIVARMTAEELIVELRGRTLEKSRRISMIPLSSVPVAQSCETCGESECFRHRALHQNLDVSLRTAWLVDHEMPEHKAWLAANVEPGDILFTPSQSRHPRLARYAWTGVDVERWSPSPAFIIRRSLEARKLAEQGAARREAMLRQEGELAAFYASQVPFDSRHLVIAQSLLPELWRRGVLGGRTFSVLMSRLPLMEIHRRLDEAHGRHPERTLLGDYRAPDYLLNMEAEALGQAAEIFTPHTDIAALFGARARLLPWAMPSACAFSSGDRLFFPGPTVSRKGAYELRSVARRLNLKLAAGGSMLEGSDFWNGIDVVKASGNPFDGCRAVVLPALIEDQPRRILLALASGLPVVATRACGVPEQPGLTLVEPGDEDGLQRAIEVILG